MVEGGETAIRKKRRREEGEVEEKGGREGKGEWKKRRKEAKRSFCGGKAVRRAAATICAVSLLHRALCSLQQ